MMNQSGFGLKQKGAVWLLCLLVAAVAVGIVLRAHNLSGQIVMDDEIHSVRAAEGLPYWRTMKTFGGADICIPQTIVSKAIMQTVGLSELTLRLLPFIFGILLLAVLPVLVYRGFSPLTAVMVVWLWALSPLLVLYSRYTRPYSVCIFLVTVGVISFIYWSEERRRPWLIAYVCCGVLSAYFQVLSLVAILAPLLTDTLLHLENRQRLRANVRVGLLVITGSVVLLLPALLANFHELAQKASRSTMSWRCIDRAARLLVGTGQGWFCVVLLVGGLWAVWLSFRKDRNRTLLLISPLPLQFLSLLILRPDAISFPIVLARYMVWCWPMILLTAAWGLSGKFESGGYWLKLKAPILAILVSLLFILGPLPGMMSYHNDLIIPKQFARSVVETHYPAPAIYSRLAEEPGRFALLEVPYVYYYGLYPYDDYQQVHRREMYMGFINTLTTPNYDSEFKLNTSGFNFSKFVNLDDRSGLVHRGVKYIILHFNLIEEIGRTGSWEKVLHFEPMDMSVPHQYLESVYGPPVYQDKVLAIYQTERGASTDFRLSHTRP